MCRYCCVIVTHSGKEFSQAEPGIIKSSQAKPKKASNAVKKSPVKLSEAEPNRTKPYAPHRFTLALEVNVIKCDYLTDDSL